jgi:glycosyltransferase involved in cell wall biosynthesis
VRIALVSTPFVPVPPRAYGGTELVVHELVRGLARAGHDVVLFATGDSDGPDVRWLYERPVWPPDQTAELLHCRAAAREIRREGFDLVHGHMPALLAVADDLGAPLVHTLHHHRDERLLRLYQAHPRTKYVAISARQAQLAPELRMHVVHHGLDPERHPLGHGEGGFALFVGRLTWCKAPDDAITAARRAGVELVIAGERHQEPEDPPGWWDQVQRALAQPGVRHLGAVGGHQKQRVLGAARALLMPIRWEEPFGLVMIEAMLSGTPVIAYRRGAAPEVVEDGVTGFLVDDVAGMAETLGRVGSIDRERCRRRARERFSSSRMVADHLRVYHAALAAAPRPLLDAAGEPGYAG